MTAITIRFEGVSEKILDAMTKSGVAATKTEALRLALFNFAVDYGLVDDMAVWREMQKQFSRTPMSEDEFFKAIDVAKRNTIRR